jgi:hypothetical protein
MKLRTYPIAGLLLSVGLTAAFPASAAVTSITSAATVLGASLIVLGSPINIGPLVPASGAAPPAYNIPNSLASFNDTFGPLSISTGLLVDTASGDTTTGTGSATSTIQNLNITFDSVFSLTATTISSTSSVDGTPSATGSTTLTDLQITVLGNTVSIPVNPTPNDVIFSLAGLSIVLNQQIPEATESAGITTNAIAIDFNSFPVGLNLIHGGVDVGQSMASIDVTSVPEASTWAMMVLGLAGLGAAGYLRKTTGRTLAD